MSTESERDVELSEMNSAPAALQEKDSSRRMLSEEQ